MKKVIYLWLVLDAIFLVIFNVLFFMLTESPDAAREAAAAAGNPVAESFKYRRELGSVWLSYAFIHISYIALVVTPFITRSSKTDKAIFGTSIYAISSVYFLAQLALSLIFILAKPIDYKLALVFYIVLFGLYAVALVIFLIANEKTGEAEEIRAPMLAYVKNATARLQIAIESIEDDDVAKAVGTVYDAVSTSPVKSHPDLAEIEYSIFQGIEAIETAIEEKNNEGVIDLANNLLTKVKERNTMLKQYN
jgi:hypothetical protein